MDKIHILEMINRYEGQSVHITTSDGKFYTGMLRIRMEPDFSRRTLLVGWQENEVKPSEVLGIRPI